jgi:thiamine kinase-like enzyme
MLYSVFALQPSPAFPTDAVIKYQLDDPRNINALVREYAIVKQIKSLEIAMKPYSLSLPQTWSAANGVSEKTNLKVLNNDNNWIPALRYMILERGRMSQSAFLDTESAGSRVKTAVTVGFNMTKYLRALKGRKKVHADIRLANVVVTFDNRVKLIDFGLSYFEQDIFGFADIVRGNMRDNNCWYSLWQLEGYQTGYRDDLLRTLLIVRYLMNGDKLYNRFCRAELKPSALEAYAFRNEAFIFGDKIVRQAFPAWSEETTIEVESRLKQVLQLARAPASVRRRLIIQEFGISLLVFYMQLTLIVCVSKTRFSELKLIIKFSS